MNRRGFVRSALAAAVAGNIASRSAFAAILGATNKVTADINARTGDQQEVTLKMASVQELGDSIRGNLLLPGNEAYDQARRVLNPTFDKHPALIVQPLGTADVKDAVDFARESNLLVAVKCGGHSPSGKSTCDGGMMIDLSLLRSTRVDPVHKTVNVSGGSWLGDMDHDTMEFGLVTTAGTVSHTGVAGLTLGGGFGRLARRYGLAIDNVRGVELVTADGKFVRAYPDENPDLYWAVRGGGGNFGVATNFEFQLHEMDRTVYAGRIGFPMQEARQVLNVYAEYSAAAPNELSIDGGLMSIPDQFTGVAFEVCYSGDPKQLDRLLAPLRKAGTVLFDTVAPMDYVAVQKAGDISDPRARGTYMKSGFVSTITPAMVDAIVDGFEPDPERGLSVIWQHAGGRISQVAPDATAFAHRYVANDTLFLMDWAMGTDPTAHIAYLREYFATVEPFTRGIYVNDLMDEPQAHVNKNYLGNYDRLVKIKNQYDPDNLFRLNANIVPAAANKAAA
ncbi:MAG TPA: FAD-binding oxidoreductase [Woeseiaceae bacterium]|nr:FAD-binding oxidoreductase [Woeseiaceae bacterium]